MLQIYLEQHRTSFDQIKVKTVLKAFEERSSPLFKYDDRSK